MLFFQNNVVDLEDVQLLVIETKGEVLVVIISIWRLGC